MRTLRRICLCCIVMLAGWLPSHAQVSNNNADGVNRPAKDAAQYAPGEVIVKFRDDNGITLRRNAKGLVSASKADLTSRLQQLGISEMEQLMPKTGTPNKQRKVRGLNGEQLVEKDLTRLVVARFERKVPVEAVVKQLQQMDDVEFAEPNYYCYMCQSDDNPATYDDPMRSQQWALDAIKLPQLWALGKTESRRPVIAILDTGCDIEHPDLAANIWTNTLEANGEPYVDDDRNDYPDDIHGYNFVHMNTDLTDRSGHGTHVAGIAAAVGNNGLGVIGANPDAFIMPLKVLSDNGQGTVSNVVKGIDYAIANGADVINMSLGFATPSSSLEAAVMRAFTRSVVTVAAAGNDGESKRIYPASYQYVVGVMSSDALGKRSSFSNYDVSRWPDMYYNVMAPGVNILSTFPGGLYKSLSGTSMSTPLVAGAYSRILQYRGFDYARDYGLQGDFYFASHQAFYPSGLRKETPFDCYLMSLYNDDNRELCLNIGHEIVPTDEDGDGTVDAGETVSVYPTLRSTRGKITEAKFTLKPISPHTMDEIREGMLEDSIYAIMLDNTMSPEFYDIVETEVDYGWQINTSGEMKGKTPFTIRLHDDAPHDRYVVCMMNGKAGEVTDSTIVEFKVDNISELSGTIDHDITLPGKQFVAKHCAILPGVTVTLSEGTDLSGDVENYGTIVAGKGSILRGFFCNDEETQRGCYSPTRGGDKHGKIIIQDGAKFYHVLNDGSGQCPFNPRKEMEFYGSFIYEQDGSWGTKFLELSPFFCPDDDFITFEPGSAIYALNMGDAIDVDNIICANRTSLKGTKDKPIYIYGNATFVVNQMNPQWDNVRVMGDAEFITYPYMCCTDCRDKVVEYLDYPNIDVSGLTVVRSPMNSQNYYSAEWPRSNFYINDDLYHCQLCGKRVAGQWINDEYVGAEVDGFTQKYDIRFKNRYLRNTIGGYAEHCNIEDTYWDLDIHRPAGMNKVLFDFTFYYSDYYDFLGVCDIFTGGVSTRGTESNAIGNIYGENNQLVSFEDYWSLQYGALDTPPSEILVPEYNGSSSLDFINRHLQTSYYWPNVKYTGFAPGADRPSAKTPGMVWTVKVNGKDAHDDYDVSDPVGLGDLNIEVWFNRPMDKTVTPRVTMGLTAPYNRFEAPQGEWNPDGTVYSTTITLDAKSATNGVNYIVVSEAKDLDGIEILKEYPIIDLWGHEDTRHRFKVNVQSADALSTDLIADAGIGKVTLQWETDDASFEDLLGYNVYRYTMVKRYPWDDWNDEMIPGDTIQVNPQLVDASEKKFVDYDVVPGTTYYYLVREIGTDMQEFDVSNVVSATPVKAERGDANGSMKVDVADVMTEVLYLTGQNPKPFIFEAADVNADQQINVLDIIGTVNLIQDNAMAASTAEDEAALFWIENGILYVQTPCALSGVQVIADGNRQTNTLKASHEMAGFENVTSWLSDERFFYLSYSLNGRVLAPGKHALMEIGSASLSDLVLADTRGHNVMALSTDATAIAGTQMDQHGMTCKVADLMGRNVNAADMKSGIYVVTLMKEGKVFKTYKIMQK